MVLSDNDRLTSLAGLSALSSVGEDLFIRRNPNLVGDIDVGGAFRSIGAVGGSIFINHNANLAGLGRLPERLQGRVAGETEAKQAHAVRTHHYHAVS